MYSSEYKDHILWKSIFMPQKDEMEPILVALRLCTGKKESEKA